MTCINLYEVLTGKTSNIRHVRRFSGSPVFHVESVAEHSFYTALYALLMAEDLCSQGYSDRVDFRQLMASVLVHDLEEGISGDFPRPFKYSSPELSEALQVASRTAFEQVIDSAVDPERKPKGGMSDYLIDAWVAAKKYRSPFLNGPIIEVADYLSALSYIWQEVQLGNRTVLQHVSNLRRRIEYYKDPNRFGEVPAAIFKPYIQAMERVVNEIETQAN